MPRTPVSALKTETIFRPFGTVPNVEVALTSRVLADTPSPDEMRLGFALLDALFQEVPFCEWEH